MGRDGLVTVVYYHPEDKHELLSIKKVLASVLSVRVIVSTFTIYSLFYQILKGQFKVVFKFLLL